jgi:hypothetical protein
MLRLASNYEWVVWLNGGDLLMPWYIDEIRNEISTNCVAINGGEIWEARSGSNDRLDWSRATANVSTCVRPSETLLAGGYPDFDCGNNESFLFNLLPKVKAKGTLKNYGYCHMLASGTRYSSDNGAVSSEIMANKDCESGNVSNSAPRCEIELSPMIDYSCFTGLPENILDNVISHWGSELISVGQTVRIYAVCNHSSDEELYRRLCRSSPRGDGRWGRIQVVDSMPYDKVAVYNSASGRKLESQNCMYFLSETPSTKLRWAEEYQGIRDEGGFVYDHHCVDGWFVELTYGECAASRKKVKNLSAVVKDHAYLGLHDKRRRLARDLAGILGCHIYGQGEWADLPVGTRFGPVAKKEDALLDYKYTFNCENDRAPGYFTEKIIDAVLCECLCFYDGCPDLESFIPGGSFIRVDVDDPEAAVEIVRKSIANGEWDKRIETIREAKKIFMNTLNPLSILNKITEGRMPLL